MLRYPYVLSCQSRLRLLVAAAAAWPAAVPTSAAAAGASACGGSGATATLVPCDAERYIASRTATTCHRMSSAWAAEANGSWRAVRTLASWRAVAAEALATRESCRG